MDNKQQSEQDHIKPAHYQAGDFDVIAFCLHHKVNFTRGTAIKYLVRAGKKPSEPELRDLYKAKEFLERDIDKLESEQQMPNSAPQGSTVNHRAKSEPLVDQAGGCSLQDSLLNKTRDKYPTPPKAPVVTINIEAERALGPTVYELIYKLLGELSRLGVDTRISEPLSGFPADRVG